MLYDLVPEPPEPGSLLESVFLLISLRRREAELYQTESIVAAIAAAAVEGGADIIENALNTYKDTLFPFLAGEKVRKDDESRKILEHWAKQVFRVKPLWHSGESKKLHSRLRRTAEKVTELEAERRKIKHRRI